MPGPYTRIVWNGPQVERVTAAAMARGANLAVERLLALATPLTPFLAGDLTKAYGIFPAEPTVAGVEAGAQLQNSSEYAAFQHEGGDGIRVIRKHTTDVHPLAQTKFVENPLRENRAELFAIMAQAVAEDLA